MHEWISHFHLTRFLEALLFHFAFERLKIKFIIIKIHLKLMG